MKKKNYKFSDVYLRDEDLYNMSYHTQYDATRYNIENISFFVMKDELGNDLVKIRNSFLSKRKIITLYLNTMEIKGDIDYFMTNNRQEFLSKLKHEIISSYKPF